MLEDLDKLRENGYTQIVTPKNPDFIPDHVNFNKGLAELSIREEGVFCGVENFKVVETKNHPQLVNFTSKYIICTKYKVGESCPKPIKRCGIDPCTQYSQKSDGPYCFDGISAVKVTKGALCTNQESKVKAKISEKQTTPKNPRPLEDTIALGR